MSETTPRARKTVRKFSIDGTMQDYRSVRAASLANGISMGKVRNLIETGVYASDGSRYEWGPLVPADLNVRKHIGLHVTPETYSALLVQSRRAGMKLATYIRTILEAHVRDLAQAAQQQAAQQQAAQQQVAQQQAAQQQAAQQQAAQQQAAQQQVAAQQPA